MVSIPGGTMGSPKSEKDRDDDEQQHKVTISPFYMGTSYTGAMAGGYGE